MQMFERFVALNVYQIFKDFFKLNKCIFSEWCLLIIALSNRTVKQGQTNEDAESALRCWILSAAEIK